MNVAPMNKTAIICFIIDKCLLKLWKVSKGMRKRLKWILKHKKIQLKHYNKKALALRNLIYIKDVSYSETKEFESERGRLEYCVEIQKEIDLHSFINKRVIFKMHLTESIGPASFLEVTDIFVTDKNYDFYSSLYFKRVTNLLVLGLDSAQIRELCDRIESLKHLLIYNCLISKLDLSSKQLQFCSLINLSLSEPFILPKTLKLLHVDCVQGFECIDCDSVEEIDFLAISTLNQNQLSWLKRINNVKKLTCAFDLNECFEYLPSSIVNLEGNSMKVDEKLDASKIKQKLPMLKLLGNGINIQSFEKLKLRGSVPVLSTGKEEFTARPKKIVVRDCNFAGLEANPQIFEEVKKVWIEDEKFNLDCLPEGISYIEVHAINKKSQCLTRLEQERMEVYKNTY